MRDLSVTIFRYPGDRDESCSPACKLSRLRLVFSYQLVAVTAVVPCAPIVGGGHQHFVSTFLGIVSTFFVGCQQGIIDAMAYLDLTYFGAFQVTLDGQPITRFRSANVQGLLVYLSLQAGAGTTRAVPRDVLATLFWPDEPEKTARANLRQSLYQLRKVLCYDGTSQPDGSQPFLLIDRHTVQFNPESDYCLDVTEFARALQQEQWKAALSHYGGELLPGFVCDSVEFEEWLLLERERRQQEVMEAMSRQVEHHLHQENFADAEAMARRQLAVQPWSEVAQRQLMQSMALGGNRSGALAQYDTLSVMLMDELGVSPAPETDALYDQIVAGGLAPMTHGSGESAGKFATVTQLEPPFQAPAPPPHFVGRVEEIETLRQELTQSGSSIWAVVGMGGSGKTTLAMHVAGLLRDHFVDGMLWANTATSQPIDILNQWGTAFGYDFSSLPDLESRAATVRGMLAEKSILIVLDNVNAAEAVRPLLPSHVTCGLLLTTRNLDVAHALNAEALLLGELSPESGLALLRHILGAERVDAEPDAVEQICQMLHYLPLALEITAQRLKSRSRVKLASMAQRLSQEQHRLGLEISDRAVRTSFEVSWEGLDEEQQRIFAHLAVFGGRPLTVDALAYVVDDDPFDVEDLLYGLVALSLLQEEGESHFRQHPLLADFAGEKLGNIDSVNPDEAYGQMANYYCSFAEENCLTYSLLEPEWSNISAAIKIAHRLERWEQVLTFTDTLHQSWLIRARYSEARQAFVLAQEAAQKQDEEEAIARNLLRWGLVCVEQNAYDEAEKHLTLSLRHYYHLEEGAGIADAQFWLARINSERNRYETAFAMFRESLSIRQQLGDKTGIAAILYHQAAIHYAQNAMQEANDLAQEALLLQRGANAPRDSIPTLRLLAHIAVRNGATESALQYAEMACSLSTDLDDRGELAGSLYTLTSIYRRRGDLEKAYHHAERCLTLFRQLGIQRQEGMLLHQMSLINYHRQMYDDAVALELHSIKILRSVNHELGCAYSLRHLGDLHQTLGEPDMAKAAWQEALDIGLELQNQAISDSLEQRLQSD